ncbi:sigma-54 interaction domain-containing protein [Desulforhopalus singaporensis]|uniref:PAS domain S-box-containing protein n=1 Tax=Desulforhopalus singaporensis TaxID=91360 RepID=A0A1H0SXF8_9BACT|nr:sigma 54-interacting transcriptional regulator [Desulforhopalus singaporensis]SDP46305.1 PAS domain S-box-containing protein [Desulforhopalus singaporensis]
MKLPFQPDTTTLLEAIPYPAMILDSSFRIIVMNRLMEAMTGYPSTKVCNIHGELVIRSNTGNNRGQLYRQVFHSGEPVSVAGDILNCYRRKIRIQYHISQLTETGGDTCGLLIICEDVSAKNETDETRSENYRSFELIGYSTKMQKVFEMIPLLAQTDASVLITGETGTGKDKIAEVIHQKSPRARFPFIKVNCGALPEGLLESELFGHVKGAFTGATRNKPGMFKLADRGTLFLTEIGDMPLPLQVKLLSVLDDRKFTPVGGEQSTSVDVRIIAATHRPLQEQVRDNQFREDLFYRLNVLQTHLPPLREREGDIRYLLDHFLDKITSALGKTIVGFTPTAMQALLDYQYPGNIRELRNIVEYSANICKRKKITMEQLPPYLSEKPRREKAGDKEEINAGAKTPAPSPVATPEKKNTRSDSARSSWGDIERQTIIDALKKHDGNRTRTAADLGWGRMKLWRKMKKYQLLD